MLLTLLLSLFSVPIQDAPPCPAPSDLLELRSVHPFGQIHGLGVAQDGTRAYLGEGAAVTILDLVNTTQGPPYPTLEQPQVVARVPVEASIIELLPVGEDLWIAGGSFGLLHMDISHAQGGGCACDDFALEPGCFPVTIVDDDDLDAPGANDSDQWCFDVEHVTVSVGGNPLDLVVALFASYYDPADAATKPSELRVYLTDGTRVRRNILGEGRAYEFAVHQPDAQTNLAYVAMGTGGIMKMDLLNGALFGGPVFDPQNPPSPPPEETGLVVPAYNGFGIVRGVAIADDWLFASVDDWGLVAMPIGTSDPWPPATPLESAILEAEVNLLAADHPQTNCERRRSYAQTVEALMTGGTEGTGGRTYIVVGGSNRPVFKEEGQPFLTYGRWNYRIDPGDAGPWRVGWQTLFVFELEGSGLVELSGLPRLAEYFHGGPRGGNFVLRPASPGSDPGVELRLYEQVFAPQLDVDRPAGFIVQDYRPTGTTPNACDPPKPYPGELIDRLAYTTWGRTPTTATVSLQNPHLLWVPAELSFVGYSGHLSFADPSCPTELEDTRDTYNEFGFMPIVARWKDVGDSIEWFLTGGAVHWYLHRRDVTNLCDVRIWQIPSPIDCDGLYGRQYFGNYLDRVLGYLLLTRGGTAEGGVVYPARDVFVETAGVPHCSELNCSQSPNPLTCVEPGIPGEPTCALSTEPLYTVLLHPEIETWNPDLSISNPGNHPNWRRTYYDGNLLVFSQKVFDDTYLGGPRRLNAVACGFSANDVDADGDGEVDDPNFEHAMLVIVDLEQDLSGADRCNGIPLNRPIGIGHGLPQTSASDVDVVRICGTTFAFVADFGGKLMLFDLSDLENPLLADVWIPPANVLDNTADTMIDTMVLEEDGIWYVYCTLTRYGLVRIELEIQDCGNGTQVLFPDSRLGFDTPRIEVRDTPGVAHYMTLRTRLCDPDPEDPDNPLDFARGLIVGDKLGGLRFYGEFEESLLPTPTCPGVTR